MDNCKKKKVGCFFSLLHHGTHVQLQVGIRIYLVETSSLIDKKNEGNFFVFTHLQNQREEVKDEESNESTYWI